MISLIVPVYNEEKSIGALIDLTIKIMRDNFGKDQFEILVIDDGSNDMSQDIIKERKCKEIRLIEHKTRRGVGAARTTGVLHAKSDKILFIDADSTYDPQDLPKVTKLLDEYDMVIGARIKEKGTLKPLRSFMKYLFNKLAGMLTHTNIPDLNSGLRGMDKDKTKQFLYLLPNGHSWVSTITLCYLASGYTVNFLPISYSKRKGKSSFNIFRDTYSFFIMILKTIIYFYPLRVIMPISFAFFLSGIIFLIRDFMQKNIADTTILLWVVGIIVFVFALMSEQLACLRREINQKINKS